MFRGDVAFGTYVNPGLARWDRDWRIKLTQNSVDLGAKKSIGIDRQLDRSVILRIFAGIV